ncbi:MAG TPA: hypothetical protein VF158_11345, partial [Longimicrobiales bacterium]
ANGVHYDIDQTFAVVAYRHELRPDRQRTTITARGRPAGAYLRWLVRGTHGVGDVVYLECRARIITSDATSVTVQVDAVSPDGRVPQVALVELAAAEVTAGADLGVQVDAGAQWTFARPPFRAGEGMARFRAAAAGYQSDDDAVVIPEVGRDTVQLTMRVRPLSQTATTAAFRVSIGDPEYAELAGAVSVSWDDAGSTGGITPASPQTIPAAAIRATPAETEAAGGYVDITITKPAAGAGPGRVVLEATRPGRVRDIDAVDVAEIPPEGAITALPPTARIEYVLEDAVFVRLRHTGTLGEGGTGPLEYRRRVRDGSTPGPWGPGAGDGWATLPAGGATQDIPKPARDPAIVELEVRDALGLVGHDTYEIAATLGGINRETGNATWSSVEDDDPTRPRPADGATVGAPTGTIVGATLAETVEDGSLRAQIAIVPDGRALSEGTGIIDGLGVSTIYRHREEVSVGADPDGISNVDFGQPYQSAPAIALRGHQCVTYSQDLADLGATRQKLRIQAASVTPSGFVSIAEIVSTGTVTQQDDDFPSGNVLDAVGETAAATLNPGGANDHRYLVQYYVEILAAPPIGGGEVNRPTLFVAIDTDDGSGFEERAVFQYQGFADQAGFNTETWPQEVRPVIVLGLASGDQIRLRIKSWNPDKGGSFVVRGGDGSGSNAESYHGVTYTTATDETRSAIPDAGDFVEWLAQEVV